MSECGDFCGILFFKCGAGAAEYQKLESRLAEREKEIERLRGAIKKAVMRLGAPTMGYAPAIERRELKDSIEEASTVLLVALERRDEGEVGK